MQDVTNKVNLPSFYCSMSVPCRNTILSCPWRYPNADASLAACDIVKAYMRELIQENRNNAEACEIVPIKHRNHTAPRIIGFMELIFTSAPQSQHKFVLRHERFLLCISQVRQTIKTRRTIRKYSYQLLPDVSPWATNLAPLVFRSWRETNFSY